MPKDVIGTCVVVFSDPRGNVDYVSPGRYRIHQAVTATGGEVRVAVAEMLEVVHVVRQLKVPTHVLSAHATGIVAICLQHHRLLSDEQFVRTPRIPGERSVIWRHKIPMSAAGSVPGEVQTCAGAVPPYTRDRHGRACGVRRCDIHAWR